MVLLFLLAARAMAQSIPVVVERLEPAVAENAAPQIVAGRYDNRFVAQDYVAITPSPQHHIWYRVRLSADWKADRAPVLRIFDPQGLVIRAYLPPAYLGVTDSIYDAQSNPGFSRHALTFVLPRTLKANVPIYLDVAPERAIPRQLAINDVVVAHVSDLAYSQLDVLFPAIQLATVLVMLCFFVALRARVYGYFVGHVFFLVVYELYEFGIGYTLPPLSLLAPLHARPMWLAATLAAILLLEFSSQFLELGRIAPRLDRILAAFRWPLAALALCAAIPALSTGWWVEDALCIIFLVMAPLLVATGLLSWQRGGRSGGFYLCAWIPGLLFVIVRVLQLGLHWPLPIWLEFALPAAFAFSSIVMSLGLADHTLLIRHERDVANRLAERDALTGVLNRRAILEQLRVAFLRARESEAPLSLLFLDIDHFKHVNDSYGHRAGDQCLRGLIDPIASELRQGDAFGRYGGEEFLIVLPGAAAVNAAVVAERIRARVEVLPLLISGTRIGLTLSVGIAAFDASVATPDDLIERADAALYQSKTAGRNLVRIHPGAATTPAEWVADA